MITFLETSASSLLQAASFLLLALTLVLIAKPSILSGPNATVTIERSARIFLVIAPIGIGCLLLSMIA